MRPGDVITIALDRSVRILKVVGLCRAARRLPRRPARFMTIFAPAGTSYAAVAGQREAGAGRPTKRERRAIDRLIDGPLGWDDEA